MKKRRSYNTRLIRQGLTYSVQEVAELYGLHKNAVLRWVKDGLPLLEPRKPYLIYGGELASYLKGKQTGRKRKCKPTEFFCCKCRTPTRARGNAANISIRNESKLLISGFCALCNTPIHRLGAVRKLPEYQKMFSIQTIQGPRITDCHPPTVICDSREKA